MNLKFCSEFDNKQTVVFKKNVNIEQLIGGRLIKYQKVTKNKLEKWQGKNLDLQYNMLHSCSEYYYIQK